MRVISGTARGRKLLSPDGLDTRPTTDRIKETIFNIIQGYVPDSSFLDLYAGSGAIGIESLSRGGKSAVFVENSPVACDLIHKNLSLAKLAEKSTVKNQDVINYLEHAAEKFDIIFFDPPYKDNPVKKILNLIDRNSLLNDGGIIISEQDADTRVYETETIKAFKIKKYPHTKAVFYKREVKP